jgi:ubiquinone/menaquinone biosynthesis C-methylase UbiE
MRSENFLETADIETSSDDYAQRFSGEIGVGLLRVQEAATLRLLAPYAGGTILDVGGGHGQLTPALVQHGYQVTVLGSAATCQRRIQGLVDTQRCLFKVGDILALPYPPRAFDVVVSYRLLPHVSRWQQFVTELTRVARLAVLVDYPALYSVNYIAPLLFPLKKRAALYRLQGSGSGRSIPVLWFQAGRALSRIFSPPGAPSPTAIA